MRSVPHVATLVLTLASWTPPLLAQVDAQRAQEFFREAQELCERDAGRLWGVSVCAPMVVGDARTQTFATSLPAPTAPRPRIIGFLNGPVEWGDTTWAAMAWETMINWPPASRGEAFLHESFHIVQRAHGIGVASRDRLGANPRTENEHLDALEGRYWLRLEWRALARALRESGAGRARAVGDALAFRQARHSQFPDHVVSEYALDMNEGLASYTATVLAAPTPSAAAARALELLDGAEQGESFVRTFSYISGPAYGVLLDAAAPGWTRRMRPSDDPVALLARTLEVRPTPDPARVAQDYGGVALRAAEVARDQERQARLADLRRRFVEGPVLVMPGGGSGLSDSRGAVVLPDIGTIYFNAYRMSGPWGTLEADGGVLISSDGESRRLPAPVQRDATTISGDGWTLTLSSGWMARAGARVGDLEVVRR